MVYKTPEWMGFLKKLFKKLKRHKEKGILFFLIVLTGLWFSFFYPELVQYQFENQLISRYLRSQDIPHEVPGRLFLSDSDIHISAGYLYVNGYEPTAFNFQHPPFIKYLYGFSILVTGNPFVVQFIFAAGLILLTYTIGRLFFKSQLTGIIAALLVLVDPLFHHVSSQALLDLGQAFFITAYAIIAIKFPRLVILQGLLLGLAAVSKFFYPVAVVWLIVQSFKWFQNSKVNVKENLIIIAAAGIVLYCSYFFTVLGKGVHSPVFYQLKMLKYWLHHSVSSYPGANLLLFLAGFYKPWWGKQQIEFSPVWSVLWPVSVTISMGKVYSFFQRKPVLKSVRVFVYIFPVVYLITLAVQAPFVRYFIIVLPWLYSGFAWSILEYIHKLLLFKKPVV